MFRKFRNRDLELERALRAARPALREDLLDSLARRLAALSPQSAGQVRQARFGFAAAVWLAGVVAFAALGGFGYAASAASAAYQTIAQTTHQGNDSHGSPSSGHNYGAFVGWGNNGDCFTTDNGDCGFHHNPGDSQYGGRYPICARTGNPSNAWVLLYISQDDIDTYAAGDALIPAPPNGCPNQNSAHAPSGTPIDSVVLSPVHPTSTTVEVATVTLNVNSAVGPISQHYVWRIDGDPVQTTDTTSLTDTLNLTGHSLGAHDSITVEVTPSAGPSHVGTTAVDGVSVTDTPPVVASVTITPNGPTTNQLLTANVSQSDADGDTITDTYQWFENGNPISGQTGPTLDLSIPGNGDHGDVITVTVVASDGIASSAPATSPADTVVNTPPTATVTLTPATPNVNNTVTATSTTADVDGDTVTVTYSWTVGGTPIASAHSSTLNLSTVPGAHKGQLVVVTATPNDGFANGTPASSTVTIANSPPVIDSVVLSPAHPHTNDIVTSTITSHDPDGDTVTYTYQWTRNGSPISGATGPSLNLATAGYGDRGDVIGLNVTPNDGTLSGAIANAASTITVDNTPPTATVALNSPLHSGDIATATATDADVDTGDTVSLIYVWKVNGVTVRTSASTPALTDHYTLAGAHHGDIVTVTVTPNDTHANGSAATATGTLVNTPPTATVALSPASPNATNTITATPTTADLDADAVTVAYAWTVGGTPIAGATSSTLNLASIPSAHKGQLVVVTATPNDGTVNGTPATASVTIANTPPVIDSVTITPATPQTNDVLSAAVTSHDRDGDTVTYTYQWTRNGSPISGATGPTLNLATAGNGNKGDVLGVTVTPNDGTVSGATANAATTVTVADTAPTATVGLSSPLVAGGLVTATATDADADGDTVNLVYVWKVNGVTVRTSPSTTALTDTYTLTGSHHGDTVSVTVTPNDGTLTGTAAVATGTVLNTPPVATVSLSPTTPNITNTVTAIPVTSDADGDVVSVAYTWTVGGIPVSGATSSTLNLATVVGAHKGQVVTVTATPNDGVVNGTAATSSVTIGNAPPVVDSVTITPASPHTNDLLTAAVTGHDPDGDTVTYTYQWTRNGSPISGATDSTLNLATAGNGNKSDVIGVTVTPNDGTVNGATANAASTLTVLDTAPTATVSITGTPSTGQVLTAHATDADVDGDAVTLIYVWKVNGTTVRTSSSTSSLTDTYTLGTVHSGDTITVTVTPNDGTLSGTAATATTTGADHPPTATVTLSPSSPVVANTVTATPTTSDPDGDAVTVAYSWTVGGNVVTGATSSTLNLSTVSGAHKGQVVTVTATPNDGTLSGTPATASVTIANSPPVIDSVTLSPNPAGTNDTLSAIVVSHDPDGDPVTYTYQWFQNGVAISGQYGYQLSLLLCGLDKNDVITVKVTPNDGTVNGATVTSGGVTITNSPPVATVHLSGSATPGGTLTATATDADSDGNTVHLIYVWKVNGTTVRTSTSTTSLTDTYTLTGAHKNDVVTVTVTPNDGSTNGTAVTATTTVGDTPPTATVSLSPSSPVATSTVTATTTKADADGDAVTLTYSWSVGGTTVSGATGSTLNLTTVSGAHKGQAVKVTVTPNDGTLNGTAVTATVTIANSPPVIDSVTLSPNPTHTSDTISAIVVSHDPDGDAVTYSYQWFQNGVAITGQYGYQLSLLDCGLDKGDVITVKVTASDGTASSATVTSPSDTVVNSAPAATVSLSPSSPTATSTVTASTSKTDADGDNVTLSYSWTVGGSTVSGATGSTLNLSSVSGAHKGQAVVVTVTPNDGTVNGTPVTASVTIANSAPVVDSATISPTSPTTTSTLTASVTGHDPDGDAITYTYQWTKNGSSISGATSSTLNLATAGVSGGESIAVKVTPSDGTASGSTFTSSSVTVTHPLTTETVAYTGATTAVYSESMTLSNTLSPAVTGANVTYSWPSGGGGSAGSVGGPANGSVGYAPNWIGPKVVTTTYAGDSTHAASSTTATVTVNARSVISVSGSPNSSKSGVSVAIHAHLTENGSTFPSGTSVVFKDGSTTIGTVAITGAGDATLNISTLSVGTHTITASYAGTGSPAYILPVSATYTQTVTSH